MQMPKTLEAVYTHIYTHTCNLLKNKIIYKDLKILFKQREFYA